jgi:hypothetical protein
MLIQVPIQSCKTLARALYWLVQQTVGLDEGTATNQESHIARHSDLWEYHFERSLLRRWKPLTLWCLLGKFVCGSSWVSFPVTYLALRLVIITFIMITENVAFLTWLLSNIMWVVESARRNYGLSIVSGGEGSPSSKSSQSSCSQRRWMEWV